MRHLLALALVTLTCLIAVPATAAESDDAPPAGRLVLVLDSSGSMAEPTGDGSTRIEAAREAVLAVVDQLPSEQPVGLRVFGATVAPGSPQADLCSDSQNTVEVGTGNRDELRSAVGTYDPLGETPIGFALQEAAKDVGREGPRSIVLVSDGEANCAPDPCVVAEELRADGVDVRIDVVGLNVDQTARDQLACVAEAGGGTYYDATDTESLVDGLTKAQERSARPFDLTGDPIEGTVDLADAPTMAAPGQYLDTLPLEGPLFYRVPRTQSGSTIHVGLTFPGTAGSAGESVYMRVYPGSAPDGQSCVSNSAFGNGIGESSPFHTGYVSTWKKTADDPCNTDDEIVLEIEPSNAATAGRPVEIAVYEEPPLADGATRDLPEAPATPTWSPLTPDAAPVDDVEPGTSSASAPVVGDGTYALDITQGETQVFAVPLDAGQSLRAQLDATLTSEATGAAVAGSAVQVEITGPLRSDDGISFYGKAPDDWTDNALSNMKAGSPFRLGAQSYTIAYLNRAKSLNERGPSTPGLRYVRVTFQAPAGSGNLPYTLTLKTDGTAGDGAADYDTSEIDAPEPDSPLVTTSAEAADTEATSGGSGDDGGFPVLPVGLGAAGLLALLAAGALVLRSRLSGRP